MKAEDLTLLLESGEKTPDEICPVLYTMSILGQRWKLPILWHLAEEGTLRYNELKRDIPIITNIMLTKSLRDLEKAFLVERREYETIPPRVEYSLTERGRTLVPILEQIHEWGADQMDMVVANAKADGKMGRAASPKDVPEHLK